MRPSSCRIRGLILDCRLDRPELCSRPTVFESIVDKLQLSQEQRVEMLRVRRLWRDFLVGYVYHLQYIFLGACVILLASYNVVSKWTLVMPNIALYNMSCRLSAS